jgi:hypothetical protein
MTPTEIKSVLSRPIESSLEAFAVLRSIARMLSREPENAEAQSLLIRSLEQREAFEGASELLNALLRETGLYPYAEPARLTSRDRLAFEFHRPEGSMGEKGTVFHRVQAQVYRALMDGANVILSAPTSFGKSLIIDAIIDSARHKRIVLVVPTIALIDETRKRLARFNDRYKIITHASQMPEQGERGAIYVLTQERVIDRSDLDEIDFSTTRSTSSSGRPSSSTSLGRTSRRSLWLSAQIMMSACSSPTIQRSRRTSSGWTSEGASRLP